MVEISNPRRHKISSWFIAVSISGVVKGLESVAFSAQTLIEQAESFPARRVQWESGVNLALKGADAIAQVAQLVLKFCHKSKPGPRGLPTIAR